MKKIFSLLATVLFAGSMMAADVTVSKSVHDLFPDDANGTQEAILYSDANLKISVNDDGNNGKIYGTGTEWRLYHTNNAVITVTATNATIKTVAFEFTVNKNGVLLFGESEMASGTAVNINAASAQFTVDGGETGKTNGQVIVKGFTVVYTPGEGGGSGEGGEGGGEGGGTGEATELTFEAAGATFDDGGAGFATWTLDLFNNETDYPEVIVTVYAKEVDKIAGTYQTSEIKEIALQLSATESGYYFANSPSASTISNISDLQINYMNNGVYKYTMSSFEFNGQTYKFDADLATTGNLHDGSDQGGGSGETGDAISLNDVVFCDAWFNMYDAEYGDISTWEFVLYKGYQNNDWVNPYVSLTVYAASESSIVGTYGFGAELQDAWADIDDETEVEAVSGGDLVVTHDSFHHYRFQFTFVADDGETYTIDKVVNTVAYDITNSDEENAPTIELDEDAEETAISNTETVVKAVKTIKDGQLIIERNGVNYNANGQIVR